ncbi:MAG: M56 family metallopeptidase [Jiangellaceae bacterium]
MIAAWLLGWAVLLAIAAPALLRRALWPQHAPRLGIALWQAASISVLVAMVLGGLALAVPVTVLSGGLADLLANCVMAIREAYRTPAGAGAAGAGLVLATVVTGRVAFCVTRTLRRARRRRRAHAAGLALVARRNDDLDALVITHHGPAAYCLASPRPAIVVTTGALEVLHAEELTAVLAHEREHLRQRHHLTVAIAQALTNAFPRLPVLRHAADEIARLVEMAADDAAGSHTSRDRLATALLALADASAPPAALAAGGPAAVARLQRLLRPAAPLSRARVAIVLAVAGLLIAAPTILAVGPAWAAGPMPQCTMSMAPAN